MPIDLHIIAAKRISRAFIFYLAEHADSRETATAVEFVKDKVKMLGYSHASARFLGGSAIVPMGVDGVPI